jgi:integral membrane protein (TIGR00529 family)
MLQMLLNASALIKVGFCFLGMLVFYELGIPLGFAILLCAGLLTAWTGTGWAGLSYQAHSFLMPHNYLLLVAILLLLFFTEALSVTGRMKRTIDALKEWLTSRKLLIGGLPALIGLLPMPGGALFSAPLVASADSDDDLSPSHKAAVNYWFRHVWEYWWPLYPGVLLAVKYAGIPAWTFYLIQMPFTIAAIAGGYFFILRSIKHKNVRPPRASRLDGAAAASTLGPIGLLVGVSMAGSMLLPYAGATGDLSSLISMIAGLLLALGVVFRNNGSAFKKALHLLGEKNTWYMMVLVLGIQVFSAILKCPLDTEAHTLVYRMQQEFMRMGIPIILVMALIPFISGTVTGVAFGFVGASFPIVFALLGHAPPLHVVIATTTFAYGCGYLGMILSPVHVCLVVTNEYFNTKLFSVYRYIVIPALIVFATCLVCSGAYFILL